MRHTAQQAGSAIRLAGGLADRQLGKLARLIPCLALAFGQLVQISAHFAMIRKPDGRLGRMDSWTDGQCDVVRRTGNAYALAPFKAALIASQ